MRLLLDTHSFLWAASSPDLLGSNARSAIEDPDNERLLSLASVWEIAIKYGLGKIDLPDLPGPFIRGQLVDLRVDLLPIRYDDAVKVAALPLHHRDPFDRL